MNLSSKGKPWLREEVDQLTREFSEGMTLREMVRIHGRTPQALISKLTHEGLIIQLGLWKTGGFYPIEQDPWVLNSELRDLIEELKE